MSAVDRRWRSLLFVPASRPDLAAKAPRSEPDAVVLDLEDAVPAHAKDEARAGLTAVRAELPSGLSVCVRVNPPGTEWFEADVAALPADLAAVVVPKVETVGQLDRLEHLLGDRPVVAGLETVRGVVDARLLLQGPVVGCYFGAEDYVADLGGVRTPDNAEVAHARASVAMAARLGGVPALDMVTLDFGDAERFVLEARQARALGYSGKLCIHPAQVGLANEAFLPSAEELDWARRLLAAFADAGGATIAFEGLMVDEVVAARARAVLATAGDD
ncbi:HpcH/HpaI aldolase/citrate lyase family protein [Rhabdothermincola salaria]|uniref:HpcH/HpaI aldolase/citrate lyase family protein n=1 Tax=Rhabdothermincola salaria TaxID=2903142 RepID=UPI001E558A8E|nr:CoA ester lyase [Rhabdothermincola salaria]MCD9624722.1 CoA ester lyase [Rhabdothermincola salaria]